MLKTGSPDDIKEMFGRLQHEAKEIIKSIIQLTYFMRGAITYYDMMEMSYPERELISEFIEERFEQEKKNPNPVY